MTFDYCVHPGVVVGMAYKCADNVTCCGVLPPYISRNPNPKCRVVTRYRIGTRPSMITRSEAIYLAYVVFRLGQDLYKS